MKRQQREIARGGVAVAGRRAVWRALSQTQILLTWRFVRLCLAFTLFTSLVCQLCADETLYLRSLVFRQNKQHAFIRFVELIRIRPFCAKWFYFTFQWYVGKLMGNIVSTNVLLAETHWLNSTALWLVIEKVDTLNEDGGCNVTETLPTTVL